MRKKIIIFAVIVVAAIIFIKLVLPIFNLGSSGSSVFSTVSTTTSSTVENYDNELKKMPARDWSVLDPNLSAEGILMESLDNNFSFYRYNAYKMWHLASLTKLITAVVVVENVGLDKRIPISTSTMAVEGEAGNLEAGEVYNSEDLLKIMLMESSNRAAAAFEEYIGSDKFLSLAKETMSKIGMTQTVIYDSSGLNDANEGTASDIYLLLKYILENDPEILTWTRLTTLSVQPLNSSRINIVSNIDPIASRADFLGGKTGTTPAAKENLATVLEFKNQRIVGVILGSNSRFDDLNTLLKWISTAYKFY
ncbi:serine hydrolase [Patescibacteria group bacterium]|nr:serine hydrolase [Patescibacteria group bacterium]